MEITYGSKTYNVDVNRDGAQLLEEMATDIDRLLGRVEALEARPTRKPRDVAPDPLGLAILSFLEAHPGLKWTPGTIAENMDRDDATTDTVGTRLRTMAEKDMVNVHMPVNAEPGRKARPTYSHRPTAGS